jgi:hypothetical protein
MFLSIFQFCAGFASGHLSISLTTSAGNSLGLQAGDERRELYQHFIEFWPYIEVWPFIDSRL